MKFSIVLPCYNEEENIPLLLKRFQTVREDVEMEVVLVDNGSKDRSASVLAELIPQYSFAKTVRVDINQGYGFGILSGLQACTGDYIGWTHADMQTDPKDVIKAARMILQAAESERENMYVKGNRKNRTIGEFIFSYGMSLFDTLYFHQPLFEINAQPSLFPRSFYNSWENPPYDFSLDLYALYLAKLQKMTIKRIDVIFPERMHGISSWNTGLASKFKVSLRTVRFSRQVKQTVRAMRNDAHV